MILKRKLVPGAWGGFTAPAQALTEEQVEEKAREILGKMTLEEKVGQMTGDMGLVAGFFEMLTSGYNRDVYPAGENLRLGVPGIRFSDGPRGMVLGHSTCFPVSMARGASWSPELEERIGDAIGVEGRAQGANFFGGVCINLLRHPAWGRAQETYGEDPYLLGEMGAGLVRGVQRHMMACIKHYACNSIEFARFKVNVKISQRALREVYTPHFKRCIDEGAGAVMSAYNKVNGQWCSHNRPLLDGLLKQEWGFQGVVVSDFINAVRDAKEAVLGGLDIEMPFRMHYARRLKKLVQSGQVPESVIDAAVLRILRAKLRFAHLGQAARYRKEAIAGPQHRALAREAAVKSMVLLKNYPAEDGQPLLPLSPDRFKKLALIGVLAKTPDTGDGGSSKVRAAHVVTPLEGLKAAWTGELVYDSGKNPRRAAETARRADVAVIVAGYTHKDEGEYYNNQGGDRLSLSLKPADEALIRAVAAANPHTLVVLVTSSAVICEAWRDQVAGILVSWYCGMEGGHALADLLLGRANPSGKLPCVFPCSPDQLPFFDRNATEIEYGLYHGYRLMDRNRQEPAFPFGFGLSYTSYAYASLSLDRGEAAAGEILTAAVQVTNTGRMAGDEIVQLYVGYDDTRVDRPDKELKGFARVHLEAGETRRVEIALPVDSLAYYDEASRCWVVEKGEYSVLVGPSSDGRSLLKTCFKIGKREEDSPQTLAPPARAGGHREQREEAF
jgi:beta-glucosidase